MRVLLISSLHGWLPYAFISYTALTPKSKVEACEWRIWLFTKQHAATWLSHLHPTWLGKNDLSEQLLSAW